MIIQSARPRFLFRSYWRNDHLLLLPKNRPLCSMKSIELRRDVERKVIRFETRQTPILKPTKSKIQKRVSRKKRNLSVEVPTTPAVTTTVMLSFPKALEGAKNKARELLDAWLYPPGSFTRMQLDKAKGVIYFLLRNESEQDRDPELVRLCWRLFQKVVDERQLQNVENDRSKQDLTSWLYDQKYLHAIIQSWAFMYKTDSKETMSPKEILLYLEQLPSKLPKYKNSRASLYAVFKTAMDAADAESSPYLGDELLQTINNICSHSEMKPETGVAFYRRLILAWVSAETLPDRDQKIANFLATIKNDKSMATIENFELLIKFWETKGEEKQLDEIFSAMESMGVQPRLTTLYSAVHGYLHSKNVEKAESCLRTMMKHCHRSLLNRHEADLVAKAARRILLWHRQRIDSKPLDDPPKMKLTVFPLQLGFADVSKCYYQTDSTDSSSTSQYRATDSAEKLVQDVRESQIFDETFIQIQFMIRLMDIYARAGVYEKADEILSTFQLRPVLRNIVMRLYGRDKMLSTISLILKKSIDEPFFAPTKELLDTVLRAWGRSSALDACYQSLALLNAMDVDFECLDVQPDAESFHLLLDCMGKAVDFEPRVWPAQILDEMEMRYQSGDVHAKPDQETYRRAVLASLRIGDMEGATNFTGQMIAFGWVPPISLYSRMLQRLASTSNRSAFSANLTDTLWKQMKQLEADHDDFRPTLACYDSAIKVWDQSGSRVAKQRILALRKKMKLCITQNS